MSVYNHSNSNSNGNSTDLLPSRNGSGSDSGGYSMDEYVNSSVRNGMSAMEDTARQHYIIGDNLRAKSFYQDAIDEFTKAVHIQEPLLGETSPEVAKTHYALGLSYRAIRQFKQALYHLAKASAIYEKQLEVDGNASASSTNKFNHPYKKEITDCKLNLARTHHSHGVALQRSGDYDQSILEHRKSLAIREHLLGKTHLETARSYYVIGCALSDRGDFDEALAELRRALRVRILIFGDKHMDTKEVVNNLGTVLTAKGGMTIDKVNQYMVLVAQSLSLENEGDKLCRLRGDYANGMVCYRKALSLEEQVLGELHPTTCDLYLRMADALGQLGDLEASLMEYKSAIQIYERIMGKFHVKVAQIYTKLAGILMDKGNFETALSFYAKSYGIYDAVLGNHDDTKQAMMNLRLAAAKERSAKESMDLIKRAEAEFKAQQQLQREQDEEIMKQEAEIIQVAGKIKPKKEKDQDAKKKKEEAKPPTPEPEDII